MTDIEARHKKELKALDTEKRSALKKIKGTAGKGKKAKELLAAAETEYETKLNELRKKHLEELSSISGDPNETEASIPANEDTVDPEEEERKRKQEKARKKREKAKEKERERERRIEEENTNAGPSARDMETAAIQELYLDALNLRIEPVAADGHCLYRSLGGQCGKSHEEMRSLCADALEKHHDEFSPFCELTDDVPDFNAYVDKVRSSVEWGGHLELRVLALALGRPIVVYSTEKPLTLEPGEDDGTDPIRVSYHKHYYALGEHYNQVVAK